MNRNSGFNVIELFVTFTVLTILGSLAYPAYKDYSRRLYYSELSTMATSYQTSVTECFHKLGSVKGCDGGKNGVLANQDKRKGNVAAVKVEAGEITLTPVSNAEIKSEDQYVLTPKIVNKKLTWLSSGDGVKKGFVE